MDISFGKLCDSDRWLGLRCKMRTHSQVIVISIIAECPYGQVGHIWWGGEREIFCTLCDNDRQLVASIKIKLGRIHRSSSSASSSSALMAKLDIFGEVATMRERERFFALYATVTVGLVTNIKLGHIHIMVSWWWQRECCWWWWWWRWWQWWCGWRWWEMFHAGSGRII